MKNKEERTAKTLHLYTAQMASYRGPDAYDITVKSGDPVFAPTWDLVQAWKAGRLTWESYTETYRAQMLRSYRENPKAWQDLLARETVTLVCYCRADNDKHCHRYLLAEFLVKLASKNGMAATNEGERQTNNIDQPDLFG